MSDEPRRDDEPRVNPYAPPAAPLGPEEGGASGARPYTFEEVRAFVGARSRSYWRAWSRPDRAGRILKGFNFAASFGNVVWFVYRKLYVEAAICMGTNVALQIGLSFFDVGGVEKAVDVSFAVACAVFANGLYERKAIKVIAEVRGEERDPERRLAKLRKRGGSNLPGALVCLVALLALAILAAAGGG